MGSKQSNMNFDFEEIGNDYYQFDNEICSYINKSEITKILLDLDVSLPSKDSIYENKS
tara:strand:- start:151 stop:324 length:174 start_codon:yes stop_codon:yes gene_type:complete